MKKVLFTTMSIIAVAAMMLVSCKKDNGTDNGKDNGKDNKPVEEYAGPVEGTSAWSVVGTLLESDWGNGAHGDYVMAEASEGIFVLKNVKLAATDEFKFRENKGWDNAYRGDFAAIGEAFDVDNTPGAPNIKPELDGIYDLYLNVAVAQAAIVAKDGAQPAWKELPKGQSFDYVMDMNDYNTNSTFKWKNGIVMNPGAITFQWKFYSTHWNKGNWSRRGYSEMDPDDNTKKLWANRLGEFGDYDESNTVLLRFSNDNGNNNGDGALCLNAGFLGMSQEQVSKDGSLYIWALNQWHVLTLTSDGSTLTLYDNDVVIKTWSQSNLSPEWEFGRFDTSMTWDDGTGYPRGQRFFGYLAYARMWGKALSAEEVAASLCDVPVDSEGLKLYWAFNLDEGSTVPNLVGSDFALNFGDCFDGNGGKKDNSAAIAGAWTDVTEVEGLAPVCPEPAAAE